MTGLHQYISAVGSFQGLMLFILLVSDRNTTAASKVLGLHCLLMGLVFFLPFITFDVAAPIFNPLAAWLFFLPVMYGCLLYLYCRKVVFSAPLRRGDLIHFTPLIACYALNYDAILYFHEDLRLWVVGAAAPTKRLWLSEYILFVVGISYLVATAFLLRNYHRQASNTLSNFNPKIFIWLGVLVASFIVIFFAKGIMAFTDFYTMNMLVLSDALIVLAIYLIALTQWKNPQIFTIKSRENEQQVLDREIGLGATENRGAVDPQTRSAMFDELTKHIEKTHSYRNSDLSLTGLAESIGFSPHHVSEVLNQHAGQNFNQFINAYRVKEVCERLSSSSSLKVLDIALESGFSSKSTFNTIFKKFTGLTPSEYRRQFQA